MNIRDPRGARLLRCGQVVADQPRHSDAAVHDRRSGRDGVLLQLEEQLRRAVRRIVHRYAARVVVRHAVHAQVEQPDVRSIVVDLLRVCEEKKAGGGEERKRPNARQTLQARRNE